MADRLHKYLAHCGIASRRGAEGVIRAGRVRVNGETVTDPAHPVAAGADRVEVDGRAVAPVAERVVLLLNKPRGYVSTASDPQGRATVLDLVPRELGRLYPVGRLDAQSEGLLLLTNDGDLTYTLTHPRHQVPRVYEVWCEPDPDPERINRLRRGAVLSDGPARPDSVERAPAGPWLRVTLREGRNREVRRLCAAVGLNVRRLRRVAFGPLRLEGLPPGAWRRLSAAEAADLRAAVRQESPAPRRSQPDEPGGGA